MTTAAPEPDSSRMDVKALSDAVAELAEWAAKHRQLLAVGRKFGFEVGVSEDLRASLRELNQSPEANYGIEQLAGVDRPPRH